MLTVALVLTGVALAVGLALQAFEENLLFFYSPSQMLAGEAPEGQDLPSGRIGDHRQRASGTRERCGFDSV